MLDDEADLGDRAGDRLADQVEPRQRFDPRPGPRDLLGRQYQIEQPAGIDQADQHDIARIGNLVGQEQLTQPRPDLALFAVIDDTEQREVKARLRQLLLTDDIPDPRDVVLVCLIDACNLLGLVLTADEIKHTTARVEQLSKMDLIGQAVTRAVSEIRLIVKHATSPIF